MLAKKFLSIFMIALCLALLVNAAQAASRQDVRSPINPGGPEDWPENQGISTATDSPQQQPSSFAVPPVQPEGLPPISPDEFAPEPQGASGVEQSVAPAPVTHMPEAGQSATGAAAQGNVGLPLGSAPQAPEPAPEREVIYVDEAGNPVEKPLDPEKLLEEARTLQDEGKFDDALPIFERIRNIAGLKPEQLEQALYGISDCLWARYQDSPLAGYEPIVSATNEALNANLRSARVPDALLRLGLANINVDNLNDANGYVTALMRRFPDYPGVAQGLTALGQAQLKANRAADAEKSFNIVLDKYPESSQLQAASVGLAHALVNQGKDDRAHMILDFISKRWPRYYINDPDFLLMQAANDEKMGNEAQAMAHHWLYVNIDPSRPENAPLLLKMADEYLKAGNAQAADFVYEGIERDFPESRAAVTAKVRLAERGINDSPITYEKMASVFDANGKNGLWRVYNELADSNVNGPDETLAALKRAMWLYWDKQYPEAMGKAADFIDAYPENANIPEARDILWNAFQKELAQSLHEHNYGRILLLWNGFPYVRERYGKIDAPLRYALAQGWQERGDDQKSFDLMAEFLNGPMDPQYGEAAFSQFFNHYLQTGQWDKILELGEKVKNWKMAPELENQLQYAEALSAQNLNLGAAALNRWKNLANRTDLPLYQQAYATYFLAKDAENRRDIRNAYELNRRMIEMFTKLGEERSDKADPERIKEGIASLMDICEVGNRVPEALQWAERYSTFIPEDSPEYPGLRFREARLHRKLGDSSRAHALLEEVAQRFPESPFAQAAAAELRTFDVSRDLQRFTSGAPAPQPAESAGSTAGNWSSTAPAQ